MGEVTILREAVAELVNDGDSVALEGFTHLIPTATRSSEAKEATGWDLKVAEELEILRDLKARTEASRKKALMRAGMCIGVGQGIAMVVENPV